MRSSRSATRFPTNADHGGTPGFPREPLLHGGVVALVQDGIQAETSEDDYSRGMDPLGKYRASTGASSVDGWSLDFEPLDNDTLMAAIERAEIDLRLSRNDPDRYRRIFGRRADGALATPRSSLWRVLL
jgi:hypothetical protein